MWTSHVQFGIQTLESMRSGKRSSFVSNAREANSPAMPYINQSSGLESEFHIETNRKFISQTGAIRKAINYHRAPAISINMRQTNRKLLMSIWRTNLSAFVSTVQNSTPSVMQATYCGVHCCSTLVKWRDAHAAVCAFRHTGCMCTSSSDSEVQMNSW